MIRAVANKFLEVTEDEYRYILELQGAFGDDAFNSLFQSGDDGIITAVTPRLDKPVPMAVVFFTLNIMMNQRLMSIDSFSDKINDLSDRVSKIEEVLSDKI
jgi:hypothetical protein